MADEDEIDVLGDFSLDTLLSKNEPGISCYDNSLISQSSELLDYGLNTPWLLDHSTSTPDCWYSNSANDYNSEDCTSATNTSLGFDEVICSENKTNDDSVWTDEEKNLLERGLEIFGKSSVRLAQFISTKSPTQIKHYLKHTYVPSSSTNGLSNVLSNSEDVDNSSVKLGSIPTVFNMSDIIEDAQIPASIEEVIAAVSTAKPTIHNMHKKKAANKKKFVQNYLKNKVLHHSHLKNNGCIPKKRMKRSTNDVTKPQKRKIFRKEKVKDRNHTINHSEELINEIEKPSSIVIKPVSSGEELIKIKKKNDDSDSDADIEIDIDECGSLETQNHPNTLSHCLLEKEVNTVKDIVPESEYEEETVSKEDLLKDVDENVMKFLLSMDIPKQEQFIEENTITDVEKVMHSEFFEGRATKTPGRYLKIRNHIIEYWIQNKPTYCTKTAVRIGLKNCGDVNCIGRIHQYLEQIGAINFGCGQINYVRPLLNIFAAFVMPVHSKEKNKKQTIIQQRSDIIRGRMKKKYNNDGEGGYTMMHNENGEIINTTVINQEKQRPRACRKQNIKLVYCKSFTNDYVAPYSVSLNIAALLMIDLHAHSALIEVMGLLGGTFDPVTRVLQIIRYIPCRSTDHSNTHCDMCPVSQSEASEALQSEGLEVIGWFHSHPTFYPNPSLQDIDTQLNMQLYLSNEYSPFVGVILSPYRSLTNSLASEYRCLIVDKNQVTADGRGVPYKFPVSVTSEGFSVSKLLKHAQYMFKMENNIPAEFLVDFQKPYFQNNTMNYMEKFLGSTKIHLARCSDINKMTCDAIMEGLTNICRNVSNKI